MYTDITSPSVGKGVCLYWSCLLLTTRGTFFIGHTRNTELQTQSKEEGEREREDWYIYNVYMRNHVHRAPQNMEKETDRERIASTYTCTHTTHTPDPRVSGVELCMKDRGGETKTEVHITRCHIPQHHIPVSGRTEQLATTTIPTENMGRGPV